MEQIVAHAQESSAIWFLMTGSVQALVEMGEENAFAMDSALATIEGDVSWGSPHFWTLVSISTSYLAFNDELV